MKTTQKDRELIERYYENDLSFGELMAFENKCADNSKFQQLVDAYEEIDAVLMRAAREEVITTQLVSTESLVPVKKTFWKLVLGAIIALMCFLGLVFWFGPQYTNEALAKVFYEEQIKKIPEAGAKAAAFPKESFGDGLLKFHKKDYPAAIIIFDRLAKKETRLSLKEELQWYVLLARLANQEVDTVKTSLHKIETTDAKELEKRLNSKFMRTLAYIYKKITGLFTKEHEITTKE